MQTERIDLGDGDYAIAYKHLLRRTVKAATEFCKKYSGMSQDQMNQAILLDSEDDLLWLYFENQITELRIKTNHHWWCFWKRKTFKPPFNKQQITKLFDNNALTKIQILEQELNRLYQPSPLAVKN